MKDRIKPIKNESDYKEALRMLESLMDKAPDKDTEDADKLNVLAILIENYENRIFSIDAPSAVEAIKFRMDQLSLRSKDLIQYIGSASQVSEILSGKKRLTVDMINALANGLDIPHKTLLKQSSDENEYSRNIPSPVFNQMIERGYFQQHCTKNEKAMVLKTYFETHSMRPSVFYRKSKFRNDDNNINHYILVAWVDRVIEKAARIKIDNKYKKEIVNFEYIKQLMKYSSDENNGPRKAIRKLLEDGVKIVIEPALSGTKLDGAVIFEDEDNPIIGLTLRYDRLDNFWFTLAHELAHIANHNKTKATIIYDDLDSDKEIISDEEKEADNLASEALIDSAKWEVSPARIIPSPAAAKMLADDLGVHISIVAGKARFESGNWKYLSRVVNKFKIKDKLKGFYDE